jgi:hypothetical protein
MRCVELVWLRSIHVDGGNKPANSSLAIISTYLSTYILHWDYLSHYCRGMLHNPEFWDNSTIPTYRSSATWPKSGTNSPTFAKLCATTFVKSPCFHRGDQTCCGTVLQNWDNLSHPPPARASESCTIPTWLFLAPSSNG